MNAGLLNPWYLLGLLSVAVPVLIHMIAQRSRTGRPFPSLMFVRRIPLQRMRRRTLRDRALLALRCAALALLALAFAGPFLTGDEPPVVQRPDVAQTVLLVDNSYSMRRDDRLARALDEALGSLDALPVGEMAALARFDDLPHTLVAMTADRSRLRQALRALPAGDGGTGYARALAHATQLFDTRIQGRRTIVLFTDLQRSGWRDAQPARLPADIELVVRDPGGPAPVGLALTGVDVAGATEAHSTRMQLIAQLLRSGQWSAQSRVRLSVDGHRAEDRALTADELSGAAAVLAAVPASDHASRVAISVEPRSQSATYRLALARVAPIAVALVTSTGTAASAIFIEQALELATRPPVLLRQVSAAAVTRELLERTDVLILATALTQPRTITLVDEFVAGGGGLLVIAGEHPRAGAALVSSGLVPGRPGATISAPTRIVHIDSTHPAFESLAAAQLRAAPVWRHRALQAIGQDRVLARFDDGTPALIERRYGAGHSMILATALEHNWAALSLEPGFPVLMIGLTRALAGRSTESGASAVTVGQVVDLRRHAVSLGETRLLQHLAQGRGVLAESPTGVIAKISAPDAVIVPREAGFYTLRLLGGDPRTVPLAVNTPPGELDPATLDLDAMLAAIERYPVEAVTNDANPVATEATMADTPWWLLMMIVTLICVVEGGYAARLSRSTHGPGPGARAAGRP